MLNGAKQEILMQLSKFNIVVEAKGFFVIDRQFIAAVGFLVEIVIELFDNRDDFGWPPPSPTGNIYGTK